MTFNMAKLDNFIKINPESIGSTFEHSEIQYIDITSVGSGQLLQTQIIAFSKAPSRARRLVNHGDTILSTVRSNRRSFLYIKNPPDNMVVSTGFAVLRPTDRIDSRFLYFLIRNQDFTDYLTNNAKGAAYPAIDTETIGRADVFLPPLPIQRRIAEILSAYDDLIENNTRRIKILEEMAQAIYREWFVHFRFPGHESVKMVETELGLIPEGWEVENLFKVADVTYGFSFKSALFTDKPTDVSVVRIRDLPKNSTETYSTEDVSNNYIILKGDIWLAWCKIRGKAHSDSGVSRTPNPGHAAQ